MYILCATVIVTYTINIVIKKREKKGWITKLEATGLTI